MKVAKAPESLKPIHTVALKDVKPGSVVRFQHDSVVDALKADLFWLAIETPELKERRRLVNLADGKVIERDPDHRMVIQQCSLVIDGI